MSVQRRSDAMTNKLRQILRRTFGMTRLRDGQAQVIDRVLAGQSTLALMPTGAGKSLCYQLPAMMIEGRTIVISPLIALMKDQCETLQGLGVAAVQLHSGLSSADVKASEAAIADGSARIIFTTPEQLSHPEFIEALKTHPIGLLVIDEAHCISQWGFDFRPSFLDIGTFAKTLGNPTVLALTATATDSVVDDITELLNIPRSGVLGTDLFRPNLHYSAEHIARQQDKMPRLIALVKATSGSGLVYVATVKKAEEVHEALVEAGEPAGLYHGRLSSSARHEAQDAFMEGRVRVMVATNAFGLGIDKSDIRFVLHYQIPPGLDAYYQESGRAGRDGLPAACTLLFTDGDRSVQQFFLSGRYPEMDDFRAIVAALGVPHPDETGWTLDTLGEQLTIHRRKMSVALNMLRRDSIVKRDAAGRFELKRGRSGKPSIDTTQLDAVVQRCRDKATEDHDMLERMVSYAQSGQCRWKLLLEQLEGIAPPERCRTCDNCLRLTRHEELAASESPSNIEDEATAPSTPTFSVGQRVRTRRHGEAKVIAATDLSVTVEFDNGESRSFQPQFLKVSRKRDAASRRADTQASLPLDSVPAPALLKPVVIGLPVSA
jgi:ATP-dependent DNA helicase RecQ